MNTEIYLKKIKIKGENIEKNKYHNMSQEKKKRLKDFTRDLFGSKIPVTTGGFELRISCIRSSYLTN